MAFQIVNKISIWIRILFIRQMLGDPERLHHIYKPTWIGSSSRAALYIFSLVSLLPFDVHGIFGAYVGFENTLPNSLLVWPWRCEEVSDVIQKLVQWINEQMKYVQICMWLIYLICPCLPVNNNENDYREN